MIRIGINGLGRIGRLVVRAWHQQQRARIVAINDLGDASTLAHLLQHDSVHGRFVGTAKATSQTLVVDDHVIPVFQEKDPARIPWAQQGVDIVLECTGLFTEADKARAHQAHGSVQKVLISAPAKKPDITLVMGVNQSAYDPMKHHVISNASCTTNCLAPVMQVLLQQFGVVEGLMTTIHSYTNDQRILDLPHKDLRRARAAALSMIPTTTGAAKALSEVLPELAGKMDGYALRVPTPNVSLLDVNVRLQKRTSIEALRDAFRQASQTPAYQGILGVSEEPLVSCDFNGDTHSAIVDLPSMQVVGDMVKVLAWYDNEMAYATRLYELALFVGQYLEKGVS